MDELQLLSEARRKGERKYLTFVWRSKTVKLLADQTTPQAHDSTEVFQPLKNLMSFERV